MAEPVDPPLSVWYCDTCDEPIRDTATGNVVWRSDDNWEMRDFRVVHKNLADERPRRCDPNGDWEYSFELSYVLGVEGQVVLTAMLSAGPLKGRKRQVGHVADLDEFVDLYRRMHLPYYEQARRHFDDGGVREWLTGASEDAPYMPDMLERIASGEFDDD